MQPVTVTEKFKDVLLSSRYSVNKILAQVGFVYVWKGGGWHPKHYTNHQNHIGSILSIYRLTIYGISRKLCSRQFES